MPAQRTVASPRASLRFGALSRQRSIHDVRLTWRNRWFPADAGGNNSCKRLHVADLKFLSFESIQLSFSRSPVGLPYEPRQRAQRSLTRRSSDEKRQYRSYNYCRPDAGRPRNGRGAEQGPPRRGVQAETHIHATQGGVRASFSTPSIAVRPDSARVYSRDGKVAG